MGPLMSSCTPHDDGRHLYRPLEAWAETDIGRSHWRLSLLMIGVGAVFSLGGLVLHALSVSLACVVRDSRAAWVEPEPDIDRAE